MLNTLKICLSSWCINANRGYHRYNSIAIYTVYDIGRSIKTRCISHQERLLSLKVEGFKLLENRPTWRKLSSRVTKSSWPEKIIIRYLTPIREVCLTNCTEWHKGAAILDKTLTRLVALFQNQNLCIITYNTTHFSSCIYICYISQISLSNDMLEAICSQLGMFTEFCSLFVRKAGSTTLIS